MRVPVRAGLVLAAAAAAASLAACGSAAAPMASGPRAHPAGTTPAPARRGPPAGGRAQAAALARLMLSRLRLPAGARRLPPAPGPPALGSPGLWFGEDPAIDVHRLFDLRQSPSAAAALTARVPAGMSQNGTGSGPADVTTWVSYAAGSLPAGISAAQLVLSVAPDSAGGSLLRADAQVMWIPPRSAAEYIDPGRYHVLTIAVTGYTARWRTIDRVVTSQAAIARLAETLDRSPAVSDQILPGCPDIVADYRLAFAVSRQSGPVVVVTTTMAPCGGAGISVGGRAQPPLQDAGAVVTMADRLLGVTSRP